VEVITCHAVTRTVKGHRKTVQRCSGRLVAGTVSFKTGATRMRATLSRGRSFHARGLSRGGHGRSLVLVVPAEHGVLRLGVYTLALSSRVHGRLITLRTRIAIRR
jgi:hypothetical protein